MPSARPRAFTPRRFWKATAKGDRWLADRIYSGVPASEFGKEQEIEIGPMSGISNVTHWLRRHGIDMDDGLLKALLGKAKAGNHTLTEEEVLNAVREYRATGPAVMTQ